MVPVAQYRVRVPRSRSRLESSLPVAGGAAPGDDLLADPGGEAGRRVVQARAQGRGLGGLLVSVAAFFGGPALGLGEVSLFGRGPRRGRGGQPRSSQVDARHGIGVGPGQPGCDPGSEVAAVGGVPAIAQAVGHQPVPQRGDRAVGEPPGRRRSGEAEPGQ